MTAARSHRILGAASGAAVVLGSLALAPAVGATPPHTGCGTVTDGASSGWCALYPGNAKGNVQEQGQVSLDSTGTQLTVLTENTADGAAPATTSVCLTATPAVDLTHRLQDSQCAKQGGVWLSWSGGAATVDLTQYPQLVGTTFTVQVQANHDAGNGNGDAFYNSVAVDSTGGGAPS